MTQSESGYSMVSLVIGFIIGMCAMGFALKPNTDTPVGYDDPFYFDDTVVFTLCGDAPTGTDTTLFCDQYDSLVKSLSDSGIQVIPFTVGDTLINFIPTRISGDLSISKYR